ncbi:SixA phosphatase family protein [Nonlabens agnitus]|uniref:Phosphoglycerate mutase n=1 Tax=Nonlabens agnitus TaxID=870484 RepID=A0A2S9WXU5_9FLAO|nr:phosphoglycerate mutase family protein [Nonlabens agnitus]PRP68283.1 phosphoglycerate mutase [Nonlabens agnitus]
MKNIVLILALALVSCNNSNSQDTEKDDDGLTTFYFIRHAEKQQGADPDLTVYGEQRATEWVNYFFLKDVDHVISSDTKRTRATAAPLAKAKKLDVETYDVSTVTGKSLLEQYRGKTVVLYGHSNTINKYANDLQKDTNYPELDDADFDHFFIVKIDENGNTNAVKESMDFDID